MERLRWMYHSHSASGKNTHLCISSISKLIFLVVVLARQEGSKSVYRCFAFDNILSKSTTAYIHIRCVQRVGWMVMEKKDTRDEQSKQQTNDQYICWSSFLSVFPFSPHSFYFIESYVWNQHSGLVQAKVIFSLFHDICAWIHLSECSLKTTLLVNVKRLWIKDGVNSPHKWIAICKMNVTFYNFRQSQDAIHIQIAKTTFEVLWCIMLACASWQS